MAGDRTLTLKILGDTKQLVDSLGKGAKETASFGQQVSDISAKVVKSFLAIGAAVGAFSIAFAKAAAEDEQAANRLAQTLKAVTNATDQQIESVNRYITATSLATGITDDDLRPAFERLARSTKNVEQSQALLNLSLDLSAATSKPLEVITSALSKAYEGNYSALSKLGLGIDASLIKHKDFDAVYKNLNATFGEFSERRSQEALVKFQRLQVAIQEAKEAVGAALLPLFERLGDWLLNEGVPRLNAFIAGLTGDKSLSSSFNQAQKEAEAFGQKIRSVIDTIVDYKGTVIATGATVATVFAVSNIAAGVAATITAIRTLISAYNALKASAIVAGVATAFALNPLLGVGAVALGASVLAAAAAISRNSDVSFDDISGAVGLGNRPLGGQIGGAGAIGGGGGGGFGGTFAGAAGGGGADSTKLGKFGSVKEMVDRLTQINEEIGALTFKYNTGQITKTEAQKALAKLQKEMTMIEGITSNLSQQQMAIDKPMAAISGGVARGEYGGVVINVNAPSAIDETGFTRAVVNALNSVERRQGGGASQLVGL